MNKIIFNINDDFRQAVKTIPNSHGVYIIYNPNQEIVYIGKGGSIKQNGSKTKQGVKNRLLNGRGKNNLTNGNYFKNRMIESEYKFITIEYIIVEDGIIPAWKEANLVQEFYEKNHKLPLWNSEF